MAEQQIRFKNDKKLGNTGLFVSELCLGTMTFQKKGGNGGPWGLPSCDTDTSHTIMNSYADMGGNFLDTANVYSDSEEVIGKWLVHKRREDFVIATKARGSMGPNVNDVGLSRKHIMWSVENSLKKLQTNYIDLLQVHTFDTETPLQETFRALSDLVRIGKIHYIGISNYSAWQLQETIDLCKYTGLEPVVSLQPQYNLLCRSTEWDLIPVCQKSNLAVLPWSPLAGGWLTGKISKESQPDSGNRVAWAEKIGWKHTNYSFHDNEVTWKTIEVVKQIAKETNRSPAQVSLRWLMQKPGVTSPIIGARTMEQFKDNVAAIEFELSEDQMKRLDEASYIAPPYPWSESWNNSRSIPLKNN